MFFFAPDGSQKSLPKAWTSEGDPDPFAVVAAGRSAEVVAERAKNATLCTDSFRAALASS